uniref:uncharacterized protein LOC120330360 n=1 Tax=Styela clava TaxID=7725 RepID=UPI00193AB31E|nr:uncharacterized protein LOC120330360 [Styela clava]
MKFILFFSLFVGVLGTSAHTELNMEDFFAKFDAQVTLREARMFDFPEEKEFSLGIYPTCDRFRYFTGPKDSCDMSGNNLSERYPLFSGCQEQNCTQLSYYGSTKCKRMVKLFKPFYHSGVECKLSKQICPAMQASKLSHLYSPTTYRPDEMKTYPFFMSNCECQTVWSIHDIFTLYEENGKLYKGNVTVKTPCKCDCRKKVEGWNGKK